MINLRIVYQANEYIDQPRFCKFKSTKALVEQVRAIQLQIEKNDYYFVALDFSPVWLDLNMRVVGYVEGDCYIKVYRGGSLYISAVDKYDHTAHFESERFSLEDLIKDTTRTKKRYA